MITHGPHWIDRLVVLLGLVIADNGLITPILTNWIEEFQCGSARCWLELDNGRLLPCWFVTILTTPCIPISTAIVMGKRCRIGAGVKGWGGKGGGVLPITVAQNPTCVPMPSNAQLIIKPIMVLVAVIEPIV